MAQAEPVSSASNSTLKANDGQQMVPTVSNNSTDNSINENDEKKANEDQNDKDKDGRRVSRQQSAPNPKVRVSFKKRKNSKKDSIAKDNTQNTNETNNDNTNSNNNNNNSTNDTNNNANANNNDSNNNNNNGEPQTNSLESSDNDSEADMKSDNPLKRWKSLPANVRYDPCREFDAFAGDWVDSKGQPVVISAWGVIRYPNNPKLRFEAVHMGPNHLSVTFDRDPKKRKFVGKLNHDCNVLIWSNDTRWSRKGVKVAKPEASTPSTNQQNANSSGSNTPTLDETEPKIDTNNKLNRQGSCIVM